MSTKRQLHPPPGHWVRGTPRVWTLLVAANVGCFAAQAIISYAHPTLLSDLFALSRDGVLGGRIWQLVTYMFLHGPTPPQAPDNWLGFGTLHLMTNMLALLFAAREVEAIFGRWHLLGIYFGGGIVGGLSHVVFSAEPAVGASAGVCAVLLAFTSALPEVELRVLVLFFIPVKMRAKRFGALLVGSTVLFIATGWLPFVAHIAHLGGALFGWIYVKKLGYGNPLPFQRYFSERRRREEHLARLSPEQFLAEEVDPILEKIAREGMRSLTREERRILQLGREKMLASTNPKH